MSNDRVEVEKIDKGYIVTVWKEKEDDEENDYGYVEPKKFAASTKEEAQKLFDKHFTF